MSDGLANSRQNVVVRPGDSIHAAARQGGKAIGGSCRAILAGNAINIEFWEDIEMSS